MEPETAEGENGHTVVDPLSVREFDSLCLLAARQFRDDLNEIRASLKKANDQQLEAFDRWAEQEDRKFWDEKYRKWKELDAVSDAALMVLFHWNECIELVLLPHSDKSKEEFFKKWLSQKACMEKEFRKSSMLHQTRFLGRERLKWFMCLVSSTVRYSG